VFVRERAFVRERVRERERDLHCGACVLEGLFCVYERKGERRERVCERECVCERESERENE